MKQRNGWINMIIPFGKNMEMMQPVQAMEEWIGLY